MLPIEISLQSIDLKKYQRRHSLQRENSLIESNGKLCYTCPCASDLTELNLYAAYKTEQERIDNYQ